MSRESIEERLSGLDAQIVETGQAVRLNGYRLAFNKKVQESPVAGYANVLPDSAGTVEGVLYDMRGLAVERLRPFNTGYELTSLQVERKDGTIETAAAFIAQPDEVEDTRLPGEQYLGYLFQTIQPLSSTYMDKLKSWPKVDLFDDAIFFGLLSPSSRDSIGRADKLRRPQDMVHMEHLIQGLYQKPEGPTQRVFAAAKIDVATPMSLLGAAVDTLISQQDITPTSLASLPPTSAHVRQALTFAWAIAANRGSNLIRSRHVLEGALSVRDCSVVMALAEKGVLPELVRDLPDSTSAQNGTIDPKARLDTTPNHADWPATIDELNRTAFADALARRLHEFRKSPRAPNHPRHPSDHDRWDGPLAIHLYGPWGSGKSSLLGFLKKKLQKGNFGSEKLASDRDSWVVVDFNAWQYQRSSTPWWWLMNAVYQQSLKQLPFCDAWILRIRENWWKVKVGWAPFVIAVLFWLIAFLLLYTSGLVRAVFSVPFSREWVKPLAEAVAPVLAVIAGVFLVTVSLGRFLLTGSPRPAQTLLLAPDPVRSLADHFRELVSWTGRRVAILIDDLDRCQASYVVELLEGIQTVFHQAAVTYVIAADRHWLRASFEKVYADFRDSLDEPGRPLGYLFLDKSFQLSAPLPYLSSERQTAYWARLIRTSELPAPTETQDALIRQAQGIVKSSTSRADLRVRLNNVAQPDRPFVAAQVVQELATPVQQTETERLLAPFAPLAEPNPRAMKRLVNAYGLREATDLLSENFANPLHLALWTILSMRWPVLAEYLEDHPDAVTLLHNERKPGDPPVPAMIEPLFRDPTVRRVVLGKDVGVSLDENGLRACLARARSSDSDKPNLPAVSNKSAETPARPNGATAG